MAQAKEDKKKTENEEMPKELAFFKKEPFKAGLGLLLFFIGAFLLLCFLSFLFTGKADQSLMEPFSIKQSFANKSDIQNYGGWIGAFLSEWLINRGFGLGSFLLVYLILNIGYNLLQQKELRLWAKIFWVSVGIIWCSITFGFVFDHFLSDYFMFIGGSHGYFMSIVLKENIGVAGTVIGIVISALLILISLNHNAIPYVRDLFNVNTYSERISSIKAKKKEVLDTFSEQPIEEEPTTAPDEAITPAANNIEEFLNEGASESKNRQFHSALDLVIPNDEPEYQELIIEEANDTDNEPYATAKEDEGGELKFNIPDEDQIVDEEDTMPESNLPDFDPTLDLSYYKYPTLDLLRQYDQSNIAQTQEEYSANKKRITETLEEYSIKIQSIKATPGPTVTLYEIIPDAGVRVSKVKGLEDDIAMRLAASGVRIIAPIPGKGTIGIEVPNKDPQIVSMYSLLASKKYRETSMELPMAMGKTITNEIHMMDLTKMPHLLVAGATGQGKSVGLNVIITSLLYKKHPAELKFVLIDPKKVEFSIYSAIEKHFLAKLPDEEDAIVTDVTKVVKTLSSLTVEMDERYNLLKKAHVRNIKEYNERFIKRRLNPEKGHRFLPYFVVVIDEFGDLIMTAGKEVEHPIARIAQLARAVGIHMIIATQRPTINIITGTIKANFPARIAFKVMQMNDSRTILDANGANQLIGRGDMLFSQGNEIVRVQCAFVDTLEVEAISEYIGKQQGYSSAFALPEYVGESKENGNMGGGVDSGELDPFFEKAARIVVAAQQGSTSMIQRQLSLGYNRAGRIMDQLERAGIVGAQTAPGKPREVLVYDEAQLDRVLQNKA